MRPRRGRGTAAALAAMTLALGSASISGCLSSRDQPVPSYTSQRVQADAKGWYHFGTYWYRGPVDAQGQPDGAGQCQTQYGELAKKPSDWVAGACEFSAGARVDALHRARTDAELARFRENRDDQIAREREDARSSAAYAASQRAENEASQREFDAAVMANIRSQGAANANLLAQVDRQTAQAAREAQQQMDQHQQQSLDASNARRQAAEQAARERQQQRQQAEASASRDARDRQLAAAARDEESARQKKAGEQIAQARQDKLAREQADRDAAAERKRLAKEKADAEAAAQRAEASAKSDYLRQLAAGTKLYARTCPGGEGKYFLVGEFPSIKPRKVDCIDVHYSVRCEGSGVATDGIATAFVGAGTDCFFGDAVTISPTPACPVKQAKAIVRELRSCGG